jgi:F-type H+-transporting ATPase subunit b
MVDLAIVAAAAHEAAGEAHEATALGLPAGGWVALSMIALILIMLWAKVPAMVGSMLDKKIDGIRHMLDEAATLRKEAEALKAEYERKVANATKHAEDITALAEHEAKAIIEKAKVDAAALITRREKMAEDKIAAAERTAIADLRAKAAEVAAVAARDLIAQNHGPAADKALVDEAIGAI